MAAVRACRVARSTHASTLLGPIRWGDTWGKMARRHEKEAACRVGRRGRAAWGEG